MSWARHVLIRADGDGRIGLGHIMRSMAVADELARTGVRVSFLSRPLPDWAAGQVRARGHAVLQQPVLDEAADADATAQIIAAEGADRVLLDHYGLTEAWTQRIDTPLAALDDLAETRRQVDLLIDASPGRQPQDYHGMIPDDATCLTGPHYAPLRPEFALARPVGGQGHVAISMGGVDPDGVTLACLEALDGLADEITVILSSAAPMLEQVRARVGAMHSRTHLLLDRTDMADVLSGMDLVIGAGGTSALERCVLGLPSVLAVLADNQVFNAAQLAKAGAVALLPALDPETIRRTVAPLLADPAKRAEMGAAAARLCDGHGAPRVAAALAGMGSGIALRPATDQDMEQVHTWQCEPGARRFARNPDVPALKDHAAWFARRLTRPHPFYIITRQGTPCGFVRLDPGDGGLEVSILISQRGQGIGRAALGLLRLAHPEPRLIAHVHPDNTASQHLFERAGYARDGADQFHSAGWADRQERHENADQ